MISGLSRIDYWSSVLDSNRLLRRYHREIWNMGYSWSRKIPQLSANVLSVSFKPFKTFKGCRSAWILISRLEIIIFRGAQAAIVVYDITSPDTFKRAQAWVKELRQQANQNIVIALAGNKADLANQRTVDNEVPPINFIIRS